MNKRSKLTPQIVGGRRKKSSVTSSPSAISNNTFKKLFNMTGASIKKQTQWKGYLPAEKKTLRGVFPDYDRDKVPNKWDCHPMNPKKQDLYSKKIFEDEDPDSYAEGFTLGKRKDQEFNDSGFDDFGEEEYDDYMGRREQEREEKKEQAFNYIVNEEPSQGAFSEDEIEQLEDMYNE